MPDGDAFRLPTFGEILGILVSILNLNDRAVGGPAARHLRKEGTVGKFFRGKPAPIKEPRILESFVKALIHSEIIPGFRDCLSVRRLMEAFGPLGLHVHLGKLPRRPDAEALLLRQLELFRNRWDRMAWDLRSQSAGAVPRSIIAEPYLRLLVVDLALRYAALARLGHLRLPDPSGPPGWSQEREPTTPLTELLDRCDPTRVIPGAEKTRRMTRASLLAYVQNLLDDEEGREEDFGQHSGARKTLDRLLQGSHRIPRESTVRRIGEILAPGIDGVTVEDITRQLRRYYALRSVAVGLAGAIAWDTVDGLARALVIYTRRLHDFYGQTRLPRQQIDAAHRLTVLLGSTFRANRFALNALQKTEKIRYWQLDIQALRDCREVERLYKCVYILSGFRSYCEAIQQKSGIPRQQAEEETRIVFRGLQGIPDDFLQEITKLSGQMSPGIKGSVVVHVHRAMKAELEDDWAIARVEWGCAAELSPEVAEYQFMLARSCFMLHDLAKAMAACRRAVERQPQNESTQIFIAVIHLDAGRPEEAIAHLEKLRQQRGMLSFYHALTFGQAYRKTTDYAASLRYFEKASEMKEDCAEAYAFAGDSAVRVGDMKKASVYEKKARHYGADDLIEELARDRR
ncbi:MAG: tetratricopeptide repeat protein [Planctomycetota bacterium]|nr:tetratricopeptide repeat protein [Planctomycetota bacterium]